MTTTFSELKARVARRLNSDQFWTDTEIGVVLNDVYLEMCEYSECYETDLTLATTTTDTYYDLEAEDPILLTPHRVWSPSTSKWLGINFVSKMDQMLGRWGASGAEPWEWFMRGASIFGIHPKPTLAGTLTLTGSAIPDEMVTALDTPVFPNQFHSGLVDGAVSILKGLERETKIAAKLYTQYTAKKEDLAWWVKQRRARVATPVVGAREGEAR